MFSIFLLKTKFAVSLNVYWIQITKKLLEMLIPRELEHADVKYNEEIYTYQFQFNIFLWFKW